MVRKELAVLVTVILSICTADPTGRVVGGQDATYAQFPHQISLREQNSHICGGSIISNTYILTAAHCVVETGVTPFPAEIFNIRAGTNNRLAGGVFRNVKRITVHEGYANFLNDLALLELDEPLVFTDKIQPIELATTEVPIGGVVTISGWGLLVHQGAGLPVLLQYNQLEAISKLKCLTQIGYYADSLLCLAHARDNGACNGDSGGPAIYNNELVGVAGFVVNGCGSDRPDGYAKVSYNIDWIREHMV